MDIDDCYNELIETKIQEIQDDFAKTKTYLELQEKLISLYNNTTDENKNLLNDYSELCNELYEKTISFVSHKAFKDGMLSGLKLSPTLSPK